MDEESGFLRASVITVGLFLGVQLGSLILVSPFDEAGYQAVENPSDPSISLLYLLVILIATGIFLVLIRYRYEWMIRASIIVIAGVLIAYVLLVVIPPLLVVQQLNLLAYALTLVLVGVLFYYPEWYVINSIGLLIGAGAAAIFGISFGLLPAIILLVGLGIYDAYSVYRSGHMLTLAESVTELKLPIVFVIPITKNYSFLAEDNQPIDSLEEREEREVYFVGLGDAVIPTILVASAAVFLDAPHLGIPGLTVTIPSLTAMAGALCGLLVLLRMVSRGKPHAGLPLLNGGAIVGYLLGVLYLGIPLSVALGMS